MDIGSAGAEALIARAPAKINLTLDVLGRRPDGYHTLRSVIQTLELHDTLELRPAAEVGFTCDDPTLDGDDNLAPRAARALRDATGYPGGVEIVLHKRIPAGAGLGGGSSDAAATLLALNRLWRLELPLDRLTGIGAALGSDVPFFFYAPTALIGGRGEFVEGLEPLPALFVVLLRPPCAISTGRIFAALQPDRYGGGAGTDRLLAARRDGLPPGRWPLSNDLQATAAELFPEVAVALARLRAAGAANAVMTGSGSTVYALFEREEEARLVHTSLAAGGHDVILSRTAAG